MLETQSDRAQPRGSSISWSRLVRAYESVRHDLLAERTGAGHWVGELSTSALSTATAVSALLLVDRHPPEAAAADTGTSFANLTNHSTLVQRGLVWLARHQNPDGGWGDTDKSYSNIATSLLVIAAFHLAGRAEAERAGVCPELLARAEAYIESQGRFAGLRRRFGQDKTFAVPILSNCALAGLVSWREVSPLPFELACFPQRWYNRLQMPVVSYAIPALVAIGQARFAHCPPRNPLIWLIRRAAITKSLEVLERMQPASGGYLEAVPLTSFVVMSLASIGRVQHPVVRQGVRFLLESVRPDGSWPIDTNLATWNTTLALNALGAANEDVAAVGSECLEWLLGCQQQQVHPFTGAAPGGWGWTDLSGAVPDADDTPGALLALAAWRDAPSCCDADREAIDRAAVAGIQWLLDLQNRDGGWPTFCRGWGKLPFDRSGSDLTAHVLRALRAWFALPGFAAKNAESRLEAAVSRGFDYLHRKQRADGSWIPLWFGNQDHPAEENPVYGTSKVLLAVRDHGRIGTPEARRGLEFLKATQNLDGGWGGHGNRAVAAAARKEAAGGGNSTVEETALAVEALLSGGPQMESSAMQGLRWIVERVESNRHRENAPIGFYFAKLWYHERLYPLTFAASALGRAVRERSERRPTLNTCDAGPPKST